MSRKMSRKKFIESHGASCANWSWSWSFINEDKNFIIFGAWDILTKGNTSLILREDWEIGEKTGKKKPGYSQAIKHIRLIEGGYKLKTFAMKFSDANGVGSARIKDFDKILIKRTLLKKGKNWFATDNERSNLIQKEISKILLIANDPAYRK